MSVTDSHKLKRLTTEQVTLKDKLKDIRQTQDELAKEYSKLTSSLKAVEKNIKDLSKKDVVVTEHAMLRYIQNVYGIDLEEIKEEILSDGRKQMIEFAKNGKFKINDKHELVVKNSVVVTIQPI